MRKRMIPRLTLWLFEVYFGPRASADERFGCFSADLASTDNMGPEKIHKGY